MGSWWPGTIQRREITSKGRLSIYVRPDGRLEPLASGFPVRRLQATDGASIAAFSRRSRKRAQTTRWAPPVPKSPVKRKRKANTSAKGPKCENPPKRKRRGRPPKRTRPIQESPAKAKKRPNRKQTESSESLAVAVTVPAKKAPPVDPDGTAWMKTVPGLSGDTITVWSRDIWWECLETNLNTEKRRAERQAYRQRANAAKRGGGGRGTTEVVV